MSKGSIQHRETFIANIARRLGRTAPLRELPGSYHRGIPEHAKEIELSKKEKIALFTRNWTALTGKVWLVPESKTKEHISSILQEVIQELSIEKISIWNHEKLNELGLQEQIADEQVTFIPWINEMKDEIGMEPNASDENSHPGNSEISTASSSNWAKRSALLRATERCELGIVWPDFAIANTGSILLCGGKGRGRSVSLLPGSLFGIFHEDQLVTRMGQTFPIGKERGQELMPSSFTIITGPSRSADIENDLTIGIHGPGKVFAVIIVADE